MIFSGNDKQLINTVTDATELNPDNLFDDPFVILNQPPLRELIESEPLADDPPPMSPTIPISTINVDLITLPPSMSAENKSFQPNTCISHYSPYQKKKSNRVIPCDGRYIQRIILGQILVYLFTYEVYAHNFFGKSRQVQ